MKAAKATTTAPAKKATTAAPAKKAAKATTTAAAKKAAKATTIAAAKKAAKATTTAAAKAAGKTAKTVAVQVVAPASNGEDWWATAGDELDKEAGLAERQDSDEDSELREMATAVAEGKKVAKSANVP